MNKPTHVFFDLGDTLVDLRGLIPIMESHVRSRYPALSPRAEKIAVGWVRNTVDFIQRAQGSAFRPGTEVSASALCTAFADNGAELEFRVALEIIQTAWDRYLEQARLFDDVTPELLRQLRRQVKAMGIVTDSDRSIVDPLLARLRIREFFDLVVLSEVVRAYKPNPRIFLAALEESKGTADASVFVSDSVVDLRGAAAVGMGTVWLCRGPAEGVSNPSSGGVVVRRLGELPRVLDAWA